MTSASDFLHELGAVGTGSRIKRLGERMVAQASEVYSARGIDFEARWFPLTNLLAGSGPLSIGDAALRLGLSQPAISQLAQQLDKAGLVELLPDTRDARRRIMQLSANGQERVAELEPIWSAFQEAAVELSIDAGVDFQSAIAGFESALAEQSLTARVHRELEQGVRVLKYRHDLREHFGAINAEWISDMFEIEAVDAQVLEDPQTHIIAPGGQVWFAEIPELGIVGTCALKKTGAGEYELTKMGVRSSARGRKVGEKLLRRVIFEAYKLGASRLYLLTSHLCAAAIHLYEKQGFAHCPETLARFGDVYERTDVAMVHQRT